MLISAAPGALLWPAAMIVWGPGYVSSGHAHHSVQLVMALRGRLRVRREAGDKWVDCGAALVRPDAKHEVEARNRTVLIAFVEAESELGAALSERVTEDITPISARAVTCWRAALGDVATLSASQVEAWVRGELLRGTKVPKMHPPSNACSGSCASNSVSRKPCPCRIWRRLPGCLPRALSTFLPSRLASRCDHIFFGSGCSGPAGN
jgi:hypothetical protein